MDFWDGRQTQTKESHYSLSLCLFGYSDARRTGMVLHLVKVQASRVGVYRLFATCFQIRWAWRQYSINQRVPKGGCQKQNVRLHRHFHLWVGSTFENELGFIQTNSTALRPKFNRLRYCIFHWRFNQWSLNWRKNPKVCKETQWVLRRPCDARIWLSIV